MIRRFGKLLKSKTNTAKDEFGTISAVATTTDPGIKKHVEAVSLNQVNPTVGKE
jgi:hypothetical protein